jgi:dTDP-4-dehydrorhamnose reductase
MKVLVFGKSGQVALALQRQADVIALGRDNADLSDPVACSAAIKAHSPNVVINAAAYTAVDKAESEPELAEVVNGEAPTAMAETCVELGIPFVHISTDYVFDGSGSNSWEVGDTRGPVQEYGRSKMVGEDGVTRAGGTYAILRTSWVFSGDGANFVKTMLRLGADRDALSIVGDQIGGPTPADGIAAACLTMAKALVADPSKSGTYHYSGTPDVSWAEFAKAIFDLAGLKVAVTAIPSEDYPTPAARPKNSRMDCSALETAFGVGRPDWRDAVARIIKDGV